MLDIRPATDEVSRIVAGVTDDQLAATTPCSGLTVADLLDHVGGLSLAFAMAARKDPAVADVNGTFDGSRLADDWRDSIPAALDELATAWADPSAWDGMTAAGGVEMPGEIGGLVALDEVVVHGWDLGVASGQPFEIDAALPRPCTSSSWASRSRPPGSRACSVRRSSWGSTRRSSIGSSAAQDATRLAAGNVARAQRSGLRNQSGKASRTRPPSTSTPSARRRRAWSTGL